MTVSKLTNNVKPLDEVDKINEIIDELGNIDPLPSQTGQSGKYLTTNGTVPSWADVQSLPSQTGKAGKFLQTDGTDASWESAPFRNIGEIVSSTIPLTDAGLHLLDGALIQGSGIYSAFVEYIAGLVSTYPDLFTTETNWQSTVTQYGVCGKFVYDSTSNTVRLPKITGIIEGTTDLTALGDLVEAGLPNITGWFTDGSGNNTGLGNDYSYTQVDGCFGKTSIGNGKTLMSTSSSYDRGRIDFDASNSSSIYGNSTSVQPQTIKVLYYIVIATSTKTDVQVDIDEIATDLNGKADVDLSNINPTQNIKNTIIGWGMPDYSMATSITYASGDAIGFDGYLAITGKWVNKDKTASLYIDGCLVMRQSSANDDGYSQSNHNSVFVNVSSTDVITWTNYSASSLSFSSIPFKGGN